jgi:hypothetical protein
MRIRHLALPGPQTPGSQVLSPHIQTSAIARNALVRRRSEPVICTTRFRNSLTLALLAAFLSLHAQQPVRVPNGPYRKWRNEDVVWTLPTRNAPTSRSSPTTSNAIGSSKSSGRAAIPLPARQKIHSRKNTIAESPTLMNTSPRGFPDGKPTVAASTSSTVRRIRLRAIQIQQARTMRSTRKASPTITSPSRIGTIDISRRSGGM